MGGTMMLRNLIGIGTLLAAAPTGAQVRSPRDTTSLPAADHGDDQQVASQQQSPILVNQAGRTAQSSAGQVGQRQDRNAAAEQAGIKPMARIASRIQNRVQNRLRSRIDRNYNLQANAADSFAIAEDQARTTGRPR